ncbi:MAG: hypothetical protein JWQ74_82 [Marmoricola sp.]|nr:hypothetical protein [Marmoricola sp.]
MVLGADYGVEDFGRRHLEVCALLQETLRNVEALPPQLRQRYQTYTHAWWTAVMAPHVHWGAQQDPVDILTTEHLDLLGGLSESLETRLSGTASAPLNLDLAPLKSQSEQLLSLIDEVDLPGPYRMMLVRDLEHLVWLIDNADRFGVAAAARIGQAVLGGIEVAQARVSTNDKAGWRKRVVEFGGALLILSAALDAGTAVLESGSGLVSEVVSIVSEQRPDHPNSEIEPGDQSGHGDHTSPADKGADDGH